MSTPFSNICFPFQYHLKDKLTLWEKKQTSLIRLACCRATMVTKTGRKRVKMMSMATNKRRQDQVLLQRVLGSIEAAHSSF